MDYKKLYEKAVERAKTLTNSGFNDFDFVKHIFPELKESEDERIKNEIINFIKDNTLTYTNRGSEIQIKWIAWLEKQGNLMGCLQEANKKIGELVEENYYLKEQGEQNPNLCDGCINRKGCINCENGELREVEQKPAWSEEDSPYYDDICEILINLLHSETADVNKGAIQKDLDWLESLRPQSHWKPSDEQMVAVQEAMNIVGILTITGSKINSLYQDLKKLKE